MFLNNHACSISIGSLLFTARELLIIKNSIVITYDFTNNIIISDNIRVGIGNTSGYFLPILKSSSQPF
jgi:hypothetical protein